MTPTKISEQLFIVRRYDGMDNQWWDDCDPCTWKEARAHLNKRTKNGTEKTTFADIDYFKIFPA